MREIKFRAWDKNNKKWLNRVLASRYEDGPCALVWDENKKEWLNFDEFCGDLCQFTGLQDKNGKDIYEGDILCDNYAENYPSDAREYVREHGGELEGINKNYRVYFGGFIDNIDGYANVPEWEKNERSIVGWYLQEETGRVSLAGSLYRSFSNYSSFRTNKIYHEVVGNIYENPELLEAKQ